MRRLRRPRVAPLLLAVGLLSGCAAGAAGGTPTWVPAPSFAGDGQAPGGGGSGGGGTTPTSPGAPGPSSSAAHGDPNVVATKLTSPVGIAILPDFTALVGERTTGRIVLVQDRTGQPVRTVRTLTGLDTAGDGGLLDLALSPHYDEDGLVFAYVTTPTDNRVLHFTTTGVVTPVLTGIPKAATGNQGRIAFGPDGDLYIATGSAGATATNLGAKLLRVTDVGKPAPGNPRPASPIWARGLTGVTGLCIDPQTGAVITTRSVGASDTIERVTTSGATPIVSLPHGRTGASGCAVQATALFVSTLGGHALLGAALTGSGASVSLGAIAATLDKTYGRLRTVVAAGDGSLWLTTSNRDGHGTPVPADERVLRIFPSASAVGGPPV